MGLNISVIEKYKPINREKIEQLLKMEIDSNKKKWIVLDDDPTGVQTVHDVSVYTRWDKDSIRRGFEEDNPLFFILTNSRGFTEEETIRVHREIAENVAQVSREVGKDYLFISRSDSTLRGHYPLETCLLKEVLEQQSKEVIDGEILCPFFPEGGRYTIDNVHYVKYGDELIPAGETEFAKDKTFGYKSSDLCEYVEEKTKGQYKKEQVITISLDSIHDMDIEGITDQLLKAENFARIIVNAVGYDDLKVVCTAIYRAMASGKKYMFRTAAAIVKVIGGVTDKPLLTREELIRGNNVNGGIIVVGSYTQKTTEQLNKLKEISSIRFVEFNSDLVLEEEAFQREIDRVLKIEEDAISKGQSVAVYTKRVQLVLEGDSKEEILKRSVKISDAIQALVGNLTVTPAFVVAKGGITSNDVGTKALKVKRANVLGQIKPGIPVWQTGGDSKFPGIPYVIFPGNVGDENTLKEAVEILLNL